MENPWRAIRIDGRRIPFIKNRIEELNVFAYAPTRLALVKRSDRPGYNQVEQLLFPDYMLLRFDPEVVHTTVITAIPGTYGFLSFDGQLPAIIPQWQIDRLNQAIKVHNDKLQNKGAVVIGDEASAQAMRIIVKGNTAADRQGPFFALLQQDEVRACNAEKNSAFAQSKPTRMIVSF